MAIDLNLQNLGNFPDYKHEPRIVLPDGLLTPPQLVLKWYNMLKRDEGLFTENRVRDAKSFVEKQIALSNIQPLSGLGFVILSGAADFLNIAVWDNQTPYLLKNQVYDPQKRKADIGEDGAFCAWELGIVAHEKDAWLRYLASKRGEPDKRVYLADTIGGELSTSLIERLKQYRNYLDKERRDYTRRGLTAAGPAINALTYVSRKFYSIFPELKKNKSRGRRN